MKITHDMVVEACKVFYGSRRDSVDYEEEAMRKALEAAFKAEEPLTFGGFNLDIQEVKKWDDMEIKLRLWNIILWIYFLTSENAGYRDGLYKAAKQQIVEEIAKALLEGHGQHIRTLANTYGNRDAQRALEAVKELWKD